MKPHSSTSSSEEPFDLRAAPLALVVAIVLLVGVELWVRGQDPSLVVPYENTGRQSYSSLRNFLNMDGAADIAFLGSSRGREAIVVPTCRQLVRDALGERPRVANYSSPAAAADENEQIIRLILQSEKKPQVVLYGLSPLQLSVSALKTTHAAELWYLDDWWRKVEATEARAESVRDQLELAKERDERRRLTRELSDPWHLNELPDVIRNEIGYHYLTFACRERAAKWAAVRWSKERETPCPIDGQYSDSQKRKPDRNLVDKPVAVRRVRSYLAKRMEGALYPLGGRQLDHLRSVVEQCQAADVPIVLYELPLSQILQDNFPSETIPDFLSMSEAIAIEYGIRFVRVEELGLSLTDHDFREQSHMNRPGAEKLTSALTQQVIIPILREREAALPAGG